MNFKKFINSDYLKDNPLCGISTYKDEMNLATGDCTRKIKKLVLNGEESVTYTAVQGHSRFNVLGLYATGDYMKGLCSHYNYQYANQNYNIYHSSNNNDTNVYIFDDNYTSADDFKAYLAQQYVAGTPVCIWYVLASETTEYITVPTGLSGTIEGYLNQSDTPTPTNPIYPTANTVEQWFDLKQYIMGDTDWRDATVKEWDGSQWQ